MKQIKGTIHILTIIVLLFATIGGWHLYNTYQDCQQQKNPAFAYADYKKRAIELVHDLKDKKELHEAFAKIEQIIEKYKKKQ